MRPTPLEASDLARRRQPFQPPSTSNANGTALARTYTQSWSSSAGGDYTSARGFPYYPADGGIDGAISGTNPGECSHGASTSCWFCVEL